MQLAENCALARIITFAGRISIDEVVEMIIFNLARSATYYTSRALCKLSEESRRSAPASFRPAQRGTFYLENECAVCKYQKGRFQKFTKLKM